MLRSAKCFVTGVLVILGVLFALPKVYADGDSVVDRIVLNLKESCTLEGVGMLSHTKNMTANDYQADIGSTTLTAYCNDTGGFAIYAVGYTDDEYGKTVLRNSSIDPSYDIVTGTATSGNTSNWAMKLSQFGATAPVIVGSSSDSERVVGTTPDFSGYTSVPSVWTRVAYKTSGTDVGTGATGSSLKSTYAVFISGTQPSGTYIGKVRYTLVHPYDNTDVPHPVACSAGKICYNANSSTAVGTMGQPNVNSNASETLLASNFSRTGYGFAGWSTTYDYSDPTGLYGPQETITTPAETATKGLSLYAIWVKSEGYFQDPGTTSLVCGGLTQASTSGTRTLASVSALTDKRDNQTYAIAKLADGKCWMIENLRLDSTAAHNSDGTLAQGYGTSATYGNFGGLADAESTGFKSTYSANSLYYSGTQSGTATIDIGTTNYPAYRMPRYDNRNTQSRASNPTSNFFSGNSITGMYSYGNYYTWHAAIADLTYNDTNNSSVTNTSLCPAGWHLPKGGNKSNEANNDFWSLIVTGINGGTSPANYESSTQPYYDSPEASDVSEAIRAYPNNFLYSGYLETSSANNRGYSGCYWSSTASNSSSSYNLNLYSSSNVAPGTGNYNKYNGLSIRCTVSAGT